MTKKPAKALPLALLVAPQVLLVAANAEVDPAIHSKCASVSDYAGCVKANTVGVADDDKEECFTEGGLTACIAKAGVDRLGLPKRVGWKYFTDGKGAIHYLEITGEKNTDGDWPSAWHQVPHKGQTRYIARRHVISTTYSGTAGTPGRMQNFGGGQTTCNTYGAYGRGVTSCYTSPPIQTYIPGTAGTPGGVEQLDLVEVRDCKDNTLAMYRDGKLFEAKWIKTDPMPACSRISTFPVMNMSL